jgi:hypothetical protein
MTQVYRTLRVAPSGKGVVGVVIDAPPMNLIGPELVRDLVMLIGELESGQDTSRRSPPTRCDLPSGCSASSPCRARTRSAPTRRFRQLVASDTAQARTATLFTQGLQTRGPLELHLGDRIGAL